MIIRLLGGLLLLTACGKQVNIDHTALEEASKLGTIPFKDGVIRKTASTNCLEYDGFCYSRSDNSSAMAKEFIRQASNGTNVKFIGYIQNSNCFVEKVSLNGKCINLSEIKRK